MKEKLEKKESSCSGFVLMKRVDGEERKRRWRRKKEKLEKKEAAAVGIRVFLLLYLNYPGLGFGHPG